MGKDSKEHRNPQILWECVSGGGGGVLNYIHHGAVCFTFTSVIKTEYQEKERKRR